MAEQVLGYCVVELMGHVRLGGYVTEEDRFGAKLGRIDITGPDGQVVTQYFSGGSIYRITPTTEAIAREIGAKSEAPISRWELRALEAPTPAPEGVIPGEPHDAWYCQQCGAVVGYAGEICTTCRGGEPDEPYIDDDPHMEDDPEEE